MAQVHNWTDDCFSGGANVQTNMQSVENNLMALKNTYAGTTAPVNLIAGQWWYDTSTYNAISNPTGEILKLRNQTNTAWQYIWDLKNNRPMGSVSNIGEVTYDTTGSAYQLLDPVTLSIGTTNTRVATTEFNFIIGTTPVTKTAVAAGTALPHAGSVIQSGTFGCYVVSVNGAGDIVITDGDHNYGDGGSYGSEAAALADLPATPASTLKIGHFVIAAGGTTFTEGTTPLTSKVTFWVGAASGNPPTNTYIGIVTPTPSAYSGIYYVNAEFKNYIDTPTIRLNGLSTISIVGIDGDILGISGGTIINNHNMILYYNPTTVKMVLLNPVLPEHGMAIYSTAGTYTWIRPKGVSRVKVKVIGGGLGGGNGASHFTTNSPTHTHSFLYYRGGKGGNGGYAEGFINVSSNVVVTVGNSGGSSSFVGDTTISATGAGSGGGDATDGNSENVPITFGTDGTDGTDGVGSGGTINYPIGSLSTWGKGGAGGYGAGGSGIPYGGAAGGTGLVVIEW